MEILARRRSDVERTDVCRLKTNGWFNCRREGMMTLGEEGRGCLWKLFRKDGNFGQEKMGMMSGKDSCGRPIIIII